ncbi:MAG TPA: efflux RND transporter permease subunit [Aquificales bacterium]|nr:efflux RND transporter permease subunit [Aquificales bacterium]
MPFVEFVFRRKYLIFAIFAILAVLGVIGYFTLPRKLFPDIERPHIVVVTRYPGADAENVATYVTLPIERRLQTISLVRRITSTSADGVSSIDVEFNYGKDINVAAVDVINELKKVELPPGAMSPIIFKKDSSTPPVIVLALAPKKGSHLSLADVREIAENQIKDELLRLPHVRNVDVFGGYQKEVRIELDLKKLKEYGISPADVLRVVSASNRNIPIGIVVNPNNQLTVKLLGQAVHVEQVRKLHITPTLTLGDIATVKMGHADPRSFFFANGREAVALAVQRLENGDYLKTINEVERLIPKLQKEYPEISITVADSMKEITETSFYNMLEVLRDAVVYTLLVMFLFLANIRLTLGVIFSIPFVYIGSIGVMKLFGIEFNIVSETGLILALAMLADDAVVVLENIERHITELKENVREAVIKGTAEVMFAVAGGSLAITAVLMPLFFVGGYAGKVFHFLVSTLIIAIWVSWFVSVTFLPLFAAWIFRKGEVKPTKLDLWVEKYVIPIIVTPFRNLYVALVQNFVNRPKVLPLYMVAIMLLFVLSARLVIPVLGKDTMPPMDTGVLAGQIKLDSQLSYHQVEKIAQKITEILKEEKKHGLKRYYIAFGTEPGVITVSGGGTVQNARIVLTYVDRFHRKETIWDIEHRLMKKIGSIEGVKQISLVAQGATPLSSIKGTVDTILLGDKYEELYPYAEKLYYLYHNIKGASSVTLGWAPDNLEVQFIPNFEEMRYYGVTLAQIAEQIATAVNGRVSSTFIVPNETPLPVVVQFRAEDRKDIDSLRSLVIKTPKGLVPLTQLGRLEIKPNTPILTREDLKYSIDVLVQKDTAPSSLVIMQAHKINAQFRKQLPPDIGIVDKGEFGTMKEALTKMAISFLIGAIFAYAVLVVAFESLSAPFAIILSIPLAAMGSMWFLLFGGQHRCAPAMMGLILVSGIIIRNAILLIDFAEDYMKRYGDIRKALVEAVRVRTRPVLMTAFATIAGLIPIALQKAVGLERLAPLAWVAIGGLIVGTFLTLVYVPIFYFVIHRIKTKLGFSAAPAEG